MIARSTRCCSEIGADELPIELVLNKIDAVDPLGRQRGSRTRFPARCRSRRSPARGSTSCARGSPSTSPTASRTCGCSCRTTRAALAELYALGAPIEEREDAEEGVLVRARLPRRELRRFARYLVADARRGPAAERA